MDEIRNLSNTVLTKLEARLQPNGYALENDIAAAETVVSSERSVKRPRIPTVHKLDTLAKSSETDIFDNNDSSQIYVKPPNQLDITSFFAPKVAFAPKLKRKRIKADKPEKVVNNELIELRNKVTKLEFSNLKLNKTLMELRNQQVADKELLARHKDELDRANNQLRRELSKKSALSTRVENVLIDLIREKDDNEYIEDQRKAAQYEFELGKIVGSSSKIGKKSQEKWQNGEKFNDLEYRMALLQQKRKVLENLKKELSRKKAKLKRSSADTNNSMSSLGDEKEFVVSILQDLEIYEQEENLKIKFQDLKKDESELFLENEDLRIQKFMFIRLLKRLNYQVKSQFVERPILNNRRYVLRKLLGKGGFSEVWQAFDLHLARDIAIKFHTIDRSWKQSKIEKYLAHVAREFKIHSALDHPHIVKFYTVFEIDNSTFATVSEYCPGSNERYPDLRSKIKLRKMLPEREARAILLQILAGLRYLNTGEGLEQLEEEEIANSYEPTEKLKRSTEEKSSNSKRHPSIIHYDLKPANILFDKLGNVKITDFGLSKIMHRNDCDDSGIELTSQFAGTYWYLPPECFFVPNEGTEDPVDSPSSVDVKKLLGIKGDAPMKISSKVDVWSVGIIFYQMLYGKLPFGEGMTPNTILHSQTMLKANNAEFPEKPLVSEEAKRFIRKCLTYRQQLRPDVVQLCLDPYLRQKKI